MTLFPRGLRARTTVAFALLALVLSVALAVTTYQLTRWYLLGQRETLGTRQVMLNAVVVRGLLGAGDTGPDGAISAVRSASNARAVLRVGDDWYASVVELDEATVPDSLVGAVDGGGAYRQRASVNGRPYLVIGVDLPGIDASYFEFVRFAEYERTLRTLGTILVVAASITTVAGAFAGSVAAKRVLTPLRDVAGAAAAMSDGDLSRRLDVGPDPDLEPVATSFNEMAASLEERIAREQRFTADVSHELRTPLTAMAAAVNLARRAAPTGRVAFAIEVLDQQVAHLRTLTLELLEISRLDAGASTLERAPVDVVALVRRVAGAGGATGEVVRDELGDDRVLVLDEVRVERIVANLVENADRYAGGVVEIALVRDGDVLVITVDDAGPGIPPDERTAIFGRFHRGSAGRANDQVAGTGLGLAIVEEHVHLHGGTVEVLERPGGGSRFVVRIPVTR